MANNDGPTLPPELLVSMERYAVYRCYSDLGELLYVGESGNLGRRLASHAQKIWFLQVRGITLEWYADELDALKAERRAIHIEHPKYNVQHRAARTLSAPPRRSVRTAWQSMPPGRGKAAAVIKDKPGLTNAEVADLAGCDLRTVQRAKRDMNGASPGLSVEEEAARDGVSPGAVRRRRQRARKAQDRSTT